MLSGGLQGASDQPPEKANPCQCTGLKSLELANDMKFSKHNHDHAKVESSDMVQNPFTGYEPAIVILTGTSNTGIGIHATIADMVRTAFIDFRGTIVSGGTRTGVGGLAGDIGSRNRAGTSVYGYLPKQVAYQHRDPRYTGFVETAGPDFSLLEPIKYWQDILTAGVAPTSVTVLIIGGGVITEAEARLALALEARVIPFAGSGRAAEKLLEDVVWSKSPTLLAPPHSAEDLRKLICPQRPDSE